MSACTFFGHSNTPYYVKDALRAEISRMIEIGVTVFYVGNHGGFDHMVTKVMLELKREYKNIKFFVILAYRPKKP